MNGNEEDYLTPRGEITMVSGTEGGDMQNQEWVDEVKALLAAGAAGRTKLYEVAKAAPTGSTIACPWCGVEHTKTTYHKVFCSNGKVDKQKNCKDKFWNTATESRRSRTEYAGGFNHPAHRSGARRAW